MELSLASGRALGEVFGIGSGLNRALHGGGPPNWKHNSDQQSDQQFGSAIGNAIGPMVPRAGMTAPRRSKASFKIQDWDSNTLWARSPANCFLLLCITCMLRDDFF